MGMNQDPRGDAYGRSPERPDAPAPAGRAPQGSRGKITTRPSRESILQSYATQDEMRARDARLRSQQASRAYTASAAQRDADRAARREALAAQQREQEAVPGWAGLRRARRGGSRRSGARASSARLERLRRRIRRRHERPGQLRRHPGRLRGADVRQDRRSPDRRSSCCDRLPLSVLRVLEKALHVRETDLSDSAEDPSRCCYCCRTCGYWALARRPCRCLRGSGLGRRSFGVDDSGANRHAGSSGCL